MPSNKLTWKVLLGLFVSTSHTSTTSAQPALPLQLNYQANFTEDVVPFNINVNKEFLQMTKLKIGFTRFAEDQEQPDFTDGPPQHNATSLAIYWNQEYDWRRIEADINSQLQQFNTIVDTGPGSNYTGPIPLHFVHHRSPRADAIPLIFVHGWPGSFLEVENIIEPLTNPPSEELPAFHVVAPSIPGFGFSPSPKKPGFGYRQVGKTFHALMQKLGYDKFVFQGGDAGDFINRYMAVDFPDSVVSGLSNFWIIPPSDEDLERYNRKKTSEDENYVIELMDQFIDVGWGYGQIQQTRPLKLASAMTDSPVGLAMWIYDSIRPGVPDPAIWTPERVITWTMMHWINGPYGGFSLYKNGAKDGTISTKGINMLPYVKQPVAISEFPYDLWFRTPLDWAQRGGNVKYRTVHETGGHFVSLSNPDLLLEDIWKFFGDSELSGTHVFKKATAEAEHDEL